MKVFVKSVEQKLVNNNGRIQKYEKVMKHNGKKAVIIENNNGKITRTVQKIKKCGNRRNRRNMSNMKHNAEKKSRACGKPPAAECVFFLKK